MFRVTTPAHIEIPVSVQPPGQGPSKITIRVRYRSIEARTGFLRRIADERLDDAAVIDDCLIGWSGLADEDGAPIAFEDDAARRAVLDHPYIYFAVRDAILDELTGAVGSRKNSPAPPATG